MNGEVCEALCLRLIWHKRRLWCVSLSHITRVIKDPSSPFYLCRHIPISLRAISKGRIVPGYDSTYEGHVQFQVCVLRFLVRST